MKTSIFLVLLGSLVLPFGSAHAVSDQWYAGFGGGLTTLQPMPLRPTLGISNKSSSGGNVLVGRDFDRRISAQATFYTLGEATYNNNQKVQFNAIDTSLVFRLYDTNDMRVTPANTSLSLYWRFAFGYMDRQANVLLGSDPGVYFGAGGGGEFFITPNYSVRVEAMYLDRDAIYASLQFVTRFGGTQRFLSDRRARDSIAEANAMDNSSYAMPSTTEPAMSYPSEQNTGDSDGDGIPNETDQCLDSTAGYPVLENGCPLLDGVLSGVTFVNGTAEFSPGATGQLDYLANVLNQYPRAKIEVHAHTDTQGTIQGQAVLTRARLKTVGTYLVTQGVRANRVGMRSFGSARPLYENSSADGRAKNNRIEIIEKSDL